MIMNLSILLSEEQVQKVSPSFMLKFTIKTSLELNSKHDSNFFDFVAHISVTSQFDTYNISTFNMNMA